MPRRSDGRDNLTTPTPACPPHHSAGVIERGTFLTFTGFINADAELHLEPGFLVSYRVNEAWEYPEGRSGLTLLTVEFVSASGSLLQQRQLVLGALCGDPGSPGQAFAASLTFHPQTVMLRFRRDDRVIAEYIAPDTKPEVTLTWTPGAEVSEWERITWRASAAGRYTRSALLYTNDAGRTWEGITPPMDVDAVGVDVDFSSLPGGVGALRLMVTDGFHTAIADSEMFRVPAKGVLLGIQTPVAGERIRSGEAVWFRGQAFDVDQRRAAGGTFVWQSSRDGFLGSGGAIRNTLSAGTHEISLSMADRTEARPVRINVDVGGEQTET